MSQIGIICIFLSILQVMSCMLCVLFGEYPNCRIQWESIGCVGMPRVFFKRSDNVCDWKQRGMCCVMCTKWCLSIKKNQMTSPQTKHREMNVETGSPTFLFYFILLYTASTSTSAFSFCIHLLDGLYFKFHCIVLNRHF